MKPIDPVDVGIVAFFIGYFAYALIETYTTHQIETYGAKPNSKVTGPLSAYALDRARRFSRNEETIDSRLTN
jgi:hypothetical protein